MQESSFIFPILTQAVSAFITGIPIAVALYVSWKKHTIETAKSFASIIVAAMDRSAEINQMNNRLSIVESSSTHQEQKIDKMSARVDEIYQILIKRNGS